MPRLDEALGEDPGTPAMLWLGGGLGLLLAGAALVAAGAFDVLSTIGTGAGLPEPVAGRVAATVAGAVVPGALAVAGSRFSGDHGAGPRRAGIALCAAALLGLWTPLAPALGPATPASPVGAAYLLGIALVFAGAAAAGLDAVDRRSTAGTVSYRRTQAEGPMPADGGTDRDDDLQSPLDDE